ncbi:hypothetical protein ACEPAI_8684 [Sanghuangporus weigelae]
MSTSASHVLVPLSYDDKEIVRLSLLDKGWKIYAVASVSLSFSYKCQSAPSTNLLGALVLFRTNIRQLVLQLLDISTSPCIIKWNHVLTNGATILEAGQDGDKRTYAVSDAEHRIKCVFADDEEASKFISKFLRTVDRIQKNTSAQQVAVNLSTLNLEDSEDQTIRGINAGRLQGSGNRSRHSSNAIRLGAGRKRYDETGERQNISVKIPQASADIVHRRASAEVGKNTPDGKDVASDAALIMKSEFLAQEGHDSNNKWVCTVNGRTYEIPDLTTKLSQLPLSDIISSETKLKGGFGIVRRTRLKDGTDVAIKTLFRDSDAHVVHRRFRNEAAMQSALKHTNILPLLGIAESEQSGLGASLVLSWMKNSDCLRYLQNPKNAEVRRLPLILGTIRGIAYLHSQGIVHGDIKVRNILISDNGQPLLSDFGLTSFANIEDRDLSTSLATAGNPRWMSPELLKAENPGKAVTKHSDIWAFSMTIIELLTGKHPFHEEDAYFIVSNYVRERFPERPQCSECLDGLWELVRKCWALEPSSRPEAEAARVTIEVISWTSGSSS